MSISTIIDPEVLGAITMEKLTSILPNLTGVDTTNEFAFGEPGTSWQVPYDKALAAFTRDGESVTLTPQDLGQDKYAMVVQRAAQAYKLPRIDQLVAKSNPRLALTTNDIVNRKIDEMAANIAGTAMTYMWQRRFDILEGAIPTANRYDFSSSGTATAAAVRTAKFKLGDKATSLKYFVCNSKVKADLEAGGHITYQPMSQIVSAYGTQVNNLGMSGSGLVPTVAGLIIVETDLAASVGTSPTTYASYLLSENSMGLYYQSNLVVDYDKNLLVDGGYEFAVPRIDFVMCLHGVSYTESTTPQVYTSAALKNTANYTLKWNQKSVGAVRLLTQ